MFNVKQLPSVGLLVPSPIYEHRTVKLLIFASSKTPIGREGYPAKARIVGFKVEFAGLPLDRIAAVLDINSQNMLSSTRQAYINQSLESDLSIGEKVEPAEIIRRIHVLGDYSVARRYVVTTRVH